MAPQIPNGRRHRAFKAALPVTPRRTCRRRGGDRRARHGHRSGTTAEDSRDVTDWLATPSHPGRPGVHRHGLPADARGDRATCAPTASRPSSSPAAAIEFMRADSRRLRHPARQVVGSTPSPVRDRVDGQPVLVRVPEPRLHRRRPGKPVGINLFIGRRPNRLRQLRRRPRDARMDDGRRRPRLGLIVHHDDAGRELAYGREATLACSTRRSSTRPGQRGWSVISMKDDWRAASSRTARGRQAEVIRRVREVPRPLVGGPGKHARQCSTVQLRVGDLCRSSCPTASSRGSGRPTWRAASRSRSLPVARLALVLGAGRPACTWPWPARGRTSRPATAESVGRSVRQRPIPAVE